MPNDLMMADTQMMPPAEQLGQAAVRRPVVSAGPTEAEFLRALRLMRAAVVPDGISKPEEGLYKAADYPNLNIPPWARGMNITGFDKSKLSPSDVEDPTPVNWPDPHNPAHQRIYRQFMKKQDQAEKRAKALLSRPRS